MVKDVVTEEPPLLLQGYSSFSRQTDSGRPRYRP